MRSETVDAEACLASCPTACCTERNSKRPTCNRKYACSSETRLSHQQWHTSSSISPAPNLHDILDQLWVDHQPEPVHSPFQDPTQKLDGRLACLPEMHVSKEHGVSHVFSQLLHLGRRAHIHVVVHVTHGPQRTRTLLCTQGSRALWTSPQSPP